MRWVNNHIYYMKKKSPLGKRILEQVQKLPFENSDKFVDGVINKTCRPVGYFPVTDSEQYRDFYNFCIFSLIKASAENRGNDVDKVLFDQPLVSLPILHHCSFSSITFDHVHSALIASDVCGAASA